MKPDHSFVEEADILEESWQSALEREEEKGGFLGNLLYGTMDEILTKTNGVLLKVKEEVRWKPFTQSC